jgi:hypothetical protein
MNGLISCMAGSGAVINYDRSTNSKFIRAEAWKRVKSVNVFCALLQFELALSL